MVYGNSHEVRNCLNKATCPLVYPHFRGYALFVFSLFETYSVFP